MKPIVALILSTLLLTGCAPRQRADKSDSVVSMQVIDRNGFTETISNKDRITSFKSTDFLTPQPYQKVLRIFGKNSKGQSLSRITTYHDNGQLCQYLEAVDGRANGFYKEWFASGQLKIQASLVEGVADVNEISQTTWVFDSTCLVWDEEGNKQAQFSYQKGLLVDQALHFFPSGEIERVIPYEQGEMHGKLQAFSLNGTLMEEIPYHKGEKEGIALCYWRPETLKSKEYYSQGKLQEALYWDDQGLIVAQVSQLQGNRADFEGTELKSLCSIQNGLIEGEITHLCPNRTVQNRYTVAEGKKQGEEWEYYPHTPETQPLPKLYINWDADQIQGIIKTWYPTGQIESQREMLKNKKQGTAFAWYKNGDLMLHEEYENDLLIRGTYFKKGDKQAVSKIESGKGTASIYNADGLFLKKVQYEKGKPLLYNDSIP